MNKNQTKNLKELKNLSITIPKSRKASFNAIVALYEAGNFSNVKTAINLALKLSSRGAGPMKATEEISKLQQQMINTQASEILNIEGYNPSETAPKRSREERILNTTTTRRLKKAVEDDHENRKTHWTKSALEGSFREILIEDDFKNGNNRIMFNDQDLKDTIVKNLIRAWKAHNDNDHRVNLVSNLVIEFIMMQKNDEDRSESTSSIAKSN